MSDENGIAPKALSRMKLVIAEAFLEREPVTEPVSLFPLSTSCAATVFFIRSTVDSLCTLRITLCISRVVPGLLVCSLSLT
jgi:hypothetical protein